VALGLVGCGDEKNVGATWSGPPEPSAAGTVDVSGFGEYEADVAENWESAPALAAGQFLRLDQRTAATTTIEARSGPEGTGPTTVTVTLDGLLDDSVRSERWELVFVPEDSTFRLSDARWSQRCRPGRGHQTFGPQRCV
jgi:hypothetical protein